ncbi:MAG: hypothetical protein H6744_21780 [Deltaproteobacteria bacterium]|nr:hypothetical protein [Deltaproteobacteria bacterium]
MTVRLLAHLGCALALTALAACASDGGDVDATGPDAASPDSADGADAPAPDVASPDGAGDADATPASCRSGHRPVVFAHGLLAAGDTWAPHIQRFIENGYCPDELYRLDWNTLDFDTDTAAAQLDALIAHALDVTGASQVELVGHSAGGGLGYTFTSAPERAALIAHYAHFASNVQDGPAGADGQIPTLNVWSEADAIIKDKGDIPGATNLTLADADHYEVATRPESFAALYAFFNDGEAPQTTEITPLEPIFVSGKVLALGENLPAASATVRVYELDAATGARVGDAVAEVSVDADGAYGPIEVRSGRPHEFLVSGVTEGGQPLHYYREPFIRTNPAVYLRTLPGPDSLAGALLDSIPFSDPDQSIIVVFTASQATIAGRDTLTVDGTALSTEALASPARTAIAWFLYDADGDGQSGGTAVPQFASFPFLNAVDTWFEPGGPPVAITFDGRTLVVPALRAGLDGPVIATFD